MTGTARKPKPAAGLYLHVPFCTSVCPYCDYAVLIGYEQRRAGFVTSLLHEIEQHQGSELCFDTIYLGGGTPSSLQPSQLEQLLDAVSRHLHIVDLHIAGRPGIHLEANPEDMSAANLRAWRDLGVTTLSIGVQALDDQVLRFLARRHTADEARRNVLEAQQAGFDTVSIDLIYGFPGHEPVAWRRQLETVLRLGLEHLSCYQLTVHEGTIFGKRRQRGELSKLADGIQADLFLLTHRLLADHGLPGYEVSSFAAAPEHRSAHNQKYWRHAPYLGLGPSAHSFHGKRRWWNHRLLRRYQEAIARCGSAIAGEELLGVEDLVFEAVMLGLRTSDGVDTRLLAERYGVDLIAANRELIAELEEHGKLRCEHGHLIPTLSGMAIADTLACQLHIPAAGSPNPNEAADS